MIEFTGFPKMARLSRECIITEKIDGTNAQIYITEDGEVYAGSRTRWITPQDDNYGFARWVEGNKTDLIDLLGQGRHFGEWWGQGIQRNYGLKEKRFSPFNTERFGEVQFNGLIYTVPVLYKGIFKTEEVENALALLRTLGSMASPGFMKPEGVVCFHVAGNVGFKKTIDNDNQPKSKIP